MTRMTLVFVCIAASTTGGWCQNNTFPSSGNAGIGTMSPAGPLHVQGANGAPLLTYFTAPIGFSSYLELGPGTAGIGNHFEIQADPLGNLMFNSPGITGNVMQIINGGAV